MIMSNENVEFYELLNSITENKTFQLDLCANQVHKTLACKYLTTLQLTDLIKTVIDSPFTQSIFNTTATKIFRNSLVETVPLQQLTVIDRLLFMLETRIQSLSPVITLTNNDDKSVEVPIQQVKENLVKNIKEQINFFQPFVITHSDFTLTLDIPDLETDAKLNDEIYKDLVVDPNDKENLRELLGDAFIYEITKYFKVLTLKNNKIMDFSNISFKERVEVVQMLPASLIQQAISYIEKQKSIVEESLIFDGFYLSVDSTFFSFL